MDIVTQADLMMMHVLGEIWLFYIAFKCVSYSTAGDADVHTTRSEFLRLRCRSNSHRVSASTNIY